MRKLRVSCASCAGRPSRCQDCVLSLFLEQAPVAQEPQFEPDEVRALKELASQRLLPPLRFVSPA